MDEETTVAELREMVEQFVDERDWQSFHSPKNLTMALSIEASELMEHFQWLTIDESRQLAGDQEQCQAVGEELADVVCYAMAIANTMGIDISTAMRNKMIKNRRKYPA